ncbi:MAG: DUF2281 domain-containing protein [Planctomycetia bacterium]|nr:DUF2281 domain-containing protein [Planctomycetia bacterium]
MNLEQDVLTVLRNLPPEKQREVLDFAEFLKSKAGSPSQRRSLMGLCAAPGLSVTAEDIDEARREMWGNFPREDI